VDGWVSERASESIRAVKYLHKFNEKNGCKDSPFNKSVSQNFGGYQFNKLMYCP
jgi:hypothetical protein